MEAVSLTRRFFCGWRSFSGRQPAALIAKPLAEIGIYGFDFLAQNFRHVVGVLFKNELRHARTSGKRGFQLKLPFGGLLAFTLPMVVAFDAADLRAGDPVPVQKFGKDRLSRFFDVNRERNSMKFHGLVFFCQEILKK